LTLERQVVRTLRRFLAGEQTEARPTVRSWSRPAVGYWLSGPCNEPGRDDRKARPQAAHPLPLHHDRAQPARPKVAPEPAVRPAA
jgi:hypothetical protein